MSTRTDRAVELNAQKGNDHYNCAQAVACAYCDLLDVPHDIAKGMTQCFGLGMGNMEGVCGAIAGACSLLGMMHRKECDEQVEIRSRTMKDTKAIIAKFKERTGAIHCKDIKGVETGQMLRACPDCVRDGAEFLEEILKEHGYEI